jgi:hypothetical protein
MNAADSHVDIDALRQQAYDIELQALRADQIGQSRTSARLYLRVRALRAEAQAIEDRIGPFQPLPDDPEWTFTHPKRPGLYRWRHSPKWEPIARQVFRNPISGDLCVPSHRFSEQTPLEVLGGEWLIVDLRGVS